MAKKTTTKKVSAKKVSAKESNKKVAKEINEIVETAQQELLDLNEKITFVAKFNIVEITMKADGRWKIKMNVHKQLPHGDRDYSIKLEFDDEPFLKTIKQLEKDIKDIEENPTLLQSVDNDKINRLNHRIDDTQREMQKNKKECPNIEFVAQTEQTKWGADTSFIFKVLDSVIQPLNEQRYRLAEYRIVLEAI